MVGYWRGSNIVGGGYRGAVVGGYWKGSYIAEGIGGRGRVVGGIVAR